jgi:DNA-binding SARP family transcriptional activator
VEASTGTDPGKRPPESVRFQILGPLEIYGGTGRIRFAAHRQRVVLAMMLLDANRILPVERLIDAVWDESPPPTAKSQIQICVSSIRRILMAAGMPDAIVTQPPGYALRIEEDQLDLSAFDRLNTQARSAADDGHLEDAARIYRQALDLCRGLPLAGLESRLVQAAAQQVSERALTARESCIDIELSLGRHEDVISELMRLVVTHPLRDKLHGQLMLALYRSGRQAEALAVYRKARDELAEQHGLEPGDSLRALEHAILTNSPQLDLPEEPVADDVIATPGRRSPPQLLPTDVADFAGREDLVVALREILRPSASENPELDAVPIAVIAGRGGVGKTTLAIHLGHLLRSEFPDGQLFAHLHGAESRPPHPEQILERFLRALGLASSRTPDGADERAELFRDRLADRRVLIVLDDVASERQVIPLLPGNSSCAVLMTSRQRQSGLANAHHIDLDVLDEQLAVDMLTHMIGKERADAEPAATREVINLCGRLPLAIRIAGARLAARPHWQISQLGSRLANSMQRLDELSHHGLAVRPSIAVSYQSLDAPAQRLFRSLSVLEVPDIASWVAAPLLDLGLTEAEDLLETLVDERLLDAEQIGVRTRYHFHDLIRVYAREQLVADRQHHERRESLGRVLGTWLFLAGEAHRRLYGGDYTVLHGAGPLGKLPPATVDRLLHRPMEWLEGERAALVAAVRQAADAGFDELCWDLAMTSVTVFEAHSHFDDWRDTNDIALAACQRAGNRRGEAAMLYSLGSLSLVRQRLTEATERLNTALCIFTELDDVHGSALTLRNLAYLDRVHGDLTGALDRYEQALKMLIQVGDHVGQAHVLGGIAAIRIETNDHADARALLERALEIARSAHSSRMEAQILFRLGETQREADDMTGAEETYRAVLGRTRESGDAVGESHALYGLGQVHVRRQHYAAAESALTSALALAEQHGRVLLTARVNMILGELQHDRGNLSQAAAQLQTAIDGFDHLDMPEQHARARDRLSLVYRDLGDTGIPKQVRA